MYLTIKPQGRRSARISAWKGRRFALPWELNFHKLALFLTQEQHGINMTASAGFAKMLDWPLASLADIAHKPLTATWAI